MLPYLGINKQNYKLAHALARYHVAYLQFAHGRLTHHQIWSRNSMTPDQTLPLPLI